LNYPKILPVVLFAGFLCFLLFRKREELFPKLLLRTSVVFFLLSTSLIPWNTLVENEVPFISLIQFPFRFFVPFTLLFLLYFAIVANRWENKTWLRIAATLLILISSVQTIQNLYRHLNKWEDETFVSRHTYLFDTPDEARKTFYSRDMSKSLFVFQKTTPDYLPIYKQTKANKYDRYNEEILENETTFIKSHPDGRLSIKWKNTGEPTVHVPVIVYDRTVLMQNGQKLTDFELTDIGTPIVKQHNGINEIILYYDLPVYFYFVVAATIAGWLSFLGIYLSQKFNFRKEKNVKIS